MNFINKEAAIIMLKRQGCTIRQIKQKVHTSQFYISKVLRFYEENNTVPTQGKGGRPKKITPQLIAYVLSQTQQNAMLSDARLATLA